MENKYINFLEKIINSYAEDKNIIENNIEFIKSSIEELIEIYKVYPKWIELESILSENAKIIVVGDLHADFDALIKLIKIKILNPEFIFIFLGDYVDRGFNSNEVIVSLILLNLIYPSSIFILPGNHELYHYFKYQNAEFWLQKGKITDIFYLLKILIEFLPLIISYQKIIFIHGGFFHCDFEDKKEIEFISNLKNRKGIGLYNLIKEDETKIFEIVWSDYAEDNQEILFSSFLGRPVKTKKDIDALMKYQNINFIIRGHQPALKGISFNKSILTLLTSDIYRNIGKINGRLISVILKKNLINGLDFNNKIKEIIDLDDKQIFLIDID